MNVDERVFWSVKMDGKQILNSSPIALQLENETLGDNPRLLKSAEKEVNETTQAVVPYKFKNVVDRVVRQYFKQPNYVKIDGKPVFSVYSLRELVKSFDGLEGARKALDYFRQEVQKAGFPGLHFQALSYGRNGEPYLLDEKNSEGKSINEIIELLEINSITTESTVKDNEYRMSVPSV